MSSAATDRIVALGGAASGRWGLDPADLALAGFPVSFVAVFDRRVDGRALAATMEGVLDRYPVFQTTLQGSATEAWLAGPRSSTRRTGVPITISRRRESFTAVQEADRYRRRFVANLSPSAIVSGRTGPLLALRITEFDDACAIGVAWDHVVSDLHGIYGFLGEAFARFGGGPVPSTEPVFDRQEIWGGPASDREPDQHARSRVARNGIVSISPLRARAAVPRYLAQALLDDVQLCLRFEGEDRAGRSRDTFSANDLIMASLLKVFHAVRPPRRRGAALYFPIDVRPLLGLTQVTVANCIGNVSLVLTRERLEEEDVETLAGTIRREVSAYGLAQLQADRSWAEHWRARASRASVYHNWLFGADRVYSSNWASPVLTGARLGEAEFLCLLRAPTLHRLPLPAFHSTVMPSRRDRRSGRVVRLGLRRREAARLDAVLSHLPHLRRLETIDDARAV